MTEPGNALGKSGKIGQKGIYFISFHIRKPHHAVSTLLIINNLKQNNPWVNRWVNPKITQVKMKM